MASTVMQVIVATGLNAGDAEYQNIGDIAMLQAAVGRLAELWPSASINVLTDAPSELTRHCPNATALSRIGSTCWVDDHVLLGCLHGFLPKRISFRLSSMKHRLRLKSPGLLEWLIRFRFSLRDGGAKRTAFVEFMKTFKQITLLVVCGSGGFADSCRQWNLWILALIEASAERGIPVAMFGQGVGPLTDVTVLRRMEHILPNVELITLRGTRGGMALIADAGVSDSRVTTTGDEAIDLAYSHRPRTLGTAIGVNLRIAPYAEVTIDTCEKIKPALHDFAKRHDSHLLPIPIAFHGFANDPHAIRHLLAGYNDESDGGVLLDSPEKLFAQVAQCRLIVTGAYHAAVFSLAQGIPAVCLAGSPYYLAKFQGLQDLFGGGCIVVDATSCDMLSRLSTVLQTAWCSAEELRPSLLHSARRQIEAIRTSYESLSRFSMCSTA